jgi:hypothetical protein
VPRYSRRTDDRCVRPFSGTTADPMPSAPSLSANVLHSMLSQAILRCRASPPPS